MAKGLITNLDKTFNHKVRLGIMSLLMLEDWIDFNTLKASLDDINDGTLASHIKGLEKVAYIEIRKQFIGKKPNTSYKATTAGRKAFNDHLDALEQILKMRED